MGKSSLVQVLSSGEPEVCDYPFTTRSIKMGHFYVDEQRHQVGTTLLCIILGVQRLVYEDLSKGTCLCGCAAPPGGLLSMFGGSQVCRDLPVRTCLHRESTLLRRLPNGP